MADPSNTTNPSRRLFLASAPAAALLAGHVAPLVIDPIFAAIERRRATDAAFAAAAAYADTAAANQEGREVTDEDRAAEDVAYDEDAEVLAALLATTPTTRAGMRALIEYVREYDTPFAEREASFRCLNALLSSPLLAA